MNNSEGTGVGGNIVKFCDKKFWIFAEDSSDAGAPVVTRKRTVIHDLPALPVDPVRSSVSELQTVIADGAERIAAGIIGKAGAFTSTVTADAAGLEAQLASD
jgi:hypothetical protein